MSSVDPRISACRHCQHYQVQGRRGGNCQKLNVGVEAEWAACSLALPAFASPLDLIPFGRSHVIKTDRVISSDLMVSNDTSPAVVPVEITGDI